MRQSLNRVYEFLLFLLCAFVSGPCLAQSVQSSSIAINVTVVRGIEITSSSNLAFGTLVSGSGTHNIAPSDPNVGSFTFSGQPNATVSVTTPSSVILSDGNGHSLNFNPAIPIWNTSNSQTAGSQQFAASNGGSADFGPAGALFVWFGGSLNTNGAAPGTYSGSYTIDITY